MTAARGAAGALLIAVPLVFTAGFTGLQLTFDYPDILRHPAGEVLTRFASAGADLHIYWYAMMAAAIVIVLPAPTAFNTFLMEVRRRERAAMLWARRLTACLARFSADLMFATNRSPK